MARPTCVALSRPGELEPDRTRASEYSRFILDGRLDVEEANRAWMTAFMEAHGLDEDVLTVGEG